MLKAFSKWLERRRARALELEMEERARAEKLRFEKRIEPLGYLRLGAIACTLGNNPKSDGYFNPPEDIDIYSAFRDHVARLSREWRGEGFPCEDYPYRLLHVMRLLSGDISAADEVLDRLPPQPHYVDHGAGHCLLLEQRATAHVLPLPESLKEKPWQTWLAGSKAQADVRAWLKEHREKLRWEEKEGVYHLVE